MSHDHEHDHQHDDAPVALSAPAQSPYWTTLDQYYNTAEYRARLGEEFYPEAKPERYFEATEKAAASTAPVSRRTFLKLSGFAAVMAALQGCERPVTKLVPYVNAPEEIIPGVNVHYATTCMECPAACGTISANRDGRPIKIEGNPRHPISKGSTCARAQATFQHLYNPDRVTQPYEDADGSGKWLPVDWDAALPRLASELSSATGKVVLLTRTIHGPSHQRLLADLATAFPKFEHVMYDALQGGSEAKAAEALFGVRGVPRYRFAEARTVVLIGGDPIGQGASPVEYQRDLAIRRKPGPEMSRLYAFEPVPSLTGTYSDYRYRVAPQHLLTVAAALAGAVASGSEVLGRLPSVSLADAERDCGLEAGVLVKVAERLRADAGKSIVHCENASLSGPEGETLAVICLAINQALGNIGKTVDLGASLSQQALGSHAEMIRLIDEMRDGQVSAVLAVDVNPAYTLPASSGFHEAFARVPRRVSMGLYRDETAELCNLILPGKHWLECWGDAEPQQGLVSILQPMIDMPWQCRQWEESLIGVVAASGSKVFDREIPHPIDAPDDVKASPMPVRAATYHEYVQETWKAIHQQYEVEADFPNFWDSVLRIGVFDQAYRRRETMAEHQPRFRPQGAETIDRSVFDAKPAELNLVLYATGIHGDGASMQAPFLCELPDAHTKVCWDNYLAFSKATADRLGLEQGDWAAVKAGETRIEAPVWIWPGLDERTVAFMRGWGRRNGGAITTGIGVDVTPLAERNGNGLRFSGRAVQIEKVTDNLRERNSQRGPRLGAYELSIDRAIKNKYPFANVQGHNYLEGRPIFFETTLHQLDTPDFEHHIYNHHSSNAFQNMWEKEHKYAGHHWGMAIDYNACSSCGACMVACHAENNIPVVGKADVIKGREMHWIRIDRYYRGDVANPDHAFQAMLCQHCGTAPCETVCPVIATLHNDEGLNTMIYNRCVGTRYCSNNCPYKVRRFNWYQYSDYRTGFNGGETRVSPLEFALNPDVTVRSRGVMEKCTFCVHRTKRAKEMARTRGTPLMDGEMQTACQQVCPAKAITFGDRNDPASELVAKWGDKRSHGVLVDLNTQPSVRYLALVRNRDEDVPADYLGKHGSHKGDGHGKDAHDDHHDDKHGSGDGHSAVPANAGKRG